MCRDSHDGGGGEYLSASPIVEEGRSWLENWGRWSRLGIAETGYPRRCTYYLPPRRQDNDGAYDEQPEPISELDAERVDAIIRVQGQMTIRIVRMRYVDMLDDGPIIGPVMVARRLRLNADMVRGALILVERKVGQEMGRP